MSEAAALYEDDSTAGEQDLWQNAYDELLIGSTRRECVNHVIVINEGRVRRIPASYLRAITHHALIFRWNVTFRNHMPWSNRKKR